MEKTEMMKRYEVERGGIMPCGMEIPGGFIYSKEYVTWLEAKAEAYDRIMSGDTTMKEMANTLRHPLAIDSDGSLNMFYHTPRLGVDSDGDLNWWDIKRKELKLPKWFVSYCGTCEDSLTLPDGWEATDDH